MGTTPFPYRPNVVARADISGIPAIWAGRGVPYGGSIGAVGSGPDIANIAGPGGWRPGPAVIPAICIPPGAVGAMTPRAVDHGPRSTGGISPHRRSILRFRISLARASILVGGRRTPVNGRAMGVREWAGGPGPWYYLLCYTMPWIRVSRGRRIAGRRAAPPPMYTDLRKEREYTAPPMGLRAL